MEGSTFQEVPMTYSVSNPKNNMYGTWKGENAWMLMFLKGPGSGKAFFTNSEAGLRIKGVGG